MVNERIDKLVSKIDKQQAVYLKSPENIKYFSGFDGEGALIISENKRILLTDGRYTEIAKKTADNYEVIETSNHTEELKKLNNEVLFESDLPYSVFEKIQNQNIKCKKADIDFDVIRSVKDAFEIKALKKAAQIAEKSLEQLLEFITAGARENELKAKLEYFMLLNGGEGTSFDTIFISGNKTSLPHGVPSDKKLEKGDFVTVDFGCKADGYCSDMTRTFAIGSADEQMKEIYETVLYAKNETEKFIKAGANSFDCDKIARDIIKDKGYGQNFVHSTGHGVGLKIHEYPYLSPKSASVLKENNVVTVEPGIYIENKMGVRIENTVIVKEDGCEKLQNFAEKLIIL